MQSGHLSLAEAAGMCILLPIVFGHFQRRLALVRVCALSGENESRYEQRGGYARKDSPAIHGLRLDSPSLMVQGLR